METSTDPVDARSKEEIIAELEKLATEPGFIYSFCTLLLELFLHPHEAADIDWHKRLSFQELSFLGGLMIKQKINLQIPEEEIFKARIDKVHELFHELHVAFSKPFFNQLIRYMRKDSSREEVKSAFASAESMVEPIFYGGCGAYDFQYVELAKERYGADKDWIKTAKKLEIEKLGEFFFSLKKLQVEKINSRTKIDTFEKGCQEILSVFTFTRKDFPEFSDDEVKNFLDCFSLFPGRVNEKLRMPGQYNVLDSHPIVCLNDDLYFLPIAYNLAQSIYESPYYWMQGDQKYAPAAGDHRGIATSDLVYRMLAGVFGQSNVYKNVRVLRKKKETLTDIDVLAIAGNKAVVVQAKSKKLTELSRLGNEQELQSDFKVAVQEAYEQGLISRKAVLEKNVSLVDEKGNPIHLDEAIDDAYILCATADHYPALTIQVDTYLKKAKSNPLPIAVSVFDLDILCFYLKDPFEFLYYIRQRTSLCEYFRAASEISYLAFHLNQKLFKLPGEGKILIQEDVSQLIDAHFPVARGYVPQNPSATRLHSKWSNPKFEQVISQIKQSGNPRFTDAIFYLYDLAGSGADDLISLMEEVKSKSLKDGQSHNASMVFERGQSGVTFVCEVDKAEHLHERLFKLSVLRKYKSKAGLWLGLGCLKDSPNLVDGSIFNKQPWRYDENLEKGSLTGGQLRIPKRVKIGRNAPCFCGSGLKFKKCHGR